MTVLGKNHVHSDYHVQSYLLIRLCAYMPIVLDRRFNQ